MEPNSRHKMGRYSGWEWKKKPDTVGKGNGKGRGMRWGGHRHWEGMSPLEGKPGFTSYFTWWYFWGLYAMLLLLCHTSCRSWLWPCYSICLKNKNVVAPVLLITRLENAWSLNSRLNYIECVQKCILCSRFLMTGVLKCSLKKKRHHFSFQNPPLFSKGSLDV